MRLAISLAMLMLGGGLIHVAAFATEPQRTVRNDGTFRVALKGTLGSIDPAVADPTLFPVLDATCGPTHGLSG
jgi:hypothetical protein